MSEIRVTSVVGENGGDRVGLTTGLTVGPLTGTTGIGATITHQGHAVFSGIVTASSFSGIDTDKISEGNTEAEVVDTGSDGHFKVTTEGSERMRISSEGYVTKPQTPAFHVSRTSGDVSQNNYVIFNTVSYNNGSHYNNTDGKFTAPVTGIYFFSAWHYTGSTSAFGLRINGSQFGEYAWDDTGGCATWVCPVTANQYVQIYTHKTWRGSASYHNGFCGYLIG